MKHQGKCLLCKPEGLSSLDPHKDGKGKTHSVKLFFNHSHNTCAIVSVHMDVNTQINLSINILKYNITKKSRRFELKILNYAAVIRMALRKENARNNDSRWSMLLWG